jgi:carbon monoxide dehydrogenase subunit G
LKVQINKTYPMPCSPEIAWNFLQDLEAVAGCMPGAKITERLDAGRYKGTVAAKVGPVTMSFRGEVELRDVDATARTLRLLGKGTDSTGSSGASMTLVARVDAAPGGLSALVGVSELSMSGKAAAFGGRLIDTVADQILQQFADNFSNRVKDLQAERPAVVPGGRGAPATDPGQNRTAGAGELNLLALAWAIVRGWLRGLFAKKPV